MGSGEAYKKGEEKHSEKHRLRRLGKTHCLGVLVWRGRGADRFGDREEDNENQGGLLATGCKGRQERLTSSSPKREGALVMRLNWLRDNPFGEDIGGARWVNVRGGVWI